jgi:hypothetical protein
MTVERPKYKILSPSGFFGPDDHLYIEDEKGNPAVIFYDGEPNEDMEPLNEAAEDRMRTYLDKLDKLAEEVAIKNKRPFVGRPRSLDGAIALAKHDETMRYKVMGAEKDSVGIERAEVEEVPETGTPNPKRGRGRPKYKTLESVQ